MKRIFYIAHVGCLWLICSLVSASSSPFFTVAMDGPVMTITTNTPNHTYLKAGLRLETPGYGILSGCNPDPKGYCLLSVSHEQPAVITLSGPVGSISASMCLNGSAPYTCEKKVIKIRAQIPYTIYASTKYGVIETSDDGGETWTASHQPGGNLNFGLFVAPLSGTIYLGGVNGNVEFSTDGGRVWQATPAQPDGSKVNSVMLLGNTFYVGTQNGNVAYSTNNGVSWTMLPQPSSGSSVYSVFAVSGAPHNTLYAVTVSSLFVSKIKKSIDGGATWSDITPGNSFPYGTIFTSVYVANNKLYAGVNVGNNALPANGNIYIFPNGGSTWSYTLDNPSIQVSDLFVDLATPAKIYAADGAGVSTSLDNGFTWDTNTYLTPDTSTVFSAYVFNNTLYSGTFYGNLYYTALSPVSWHLTDQQPGGNLNYGFSIADDGSYYVGGTNGSVQISNNKGDTWHSSTPFTGAQNYSTLKSEGVLYAGTAFGAFGVSNDNGQSWTPYSVPYGYQGLSLFSLSHTIYMGTSGGVIYTTPDSAISWQPLLAQPDGSAVNSLYVLQGGLHPTIYAGTANGNVEISNDNGVTWNATTSPDGTAVNGISVYGTKLFAGTASGYVYTSTDAGQHWMTTAHQPDGFAVLGLVVK